MILRTVLRLVGVALSFLVAAFVGLSALIIMGAFWAGEAFREMAAAHGDWVLWRGADAVGAVFFTALVAPALTALPGLVAVVAGEVLRIRSGLYYTLAGGAALAVIPLLTGAAENGPATPPAAEYMTLFAAAGFIAGFVYWLLAGRTA